MEGAGLIAWSAPWFAPWRVPGEAAALRVAAQAPVHEALQAQWTAAVTQLPADVPVRFVSQAALPPEVPYERFIFETRSCPSRDNLHDFFNGLVWLRLPRAKARLNALQAAQIAAQGISHVRGPVRDAITVFDENGALLDAPQPLWEALAERAWRRLFVELRPLWTEARLLIFGHALLEKLLTPRKDLTAHVWRAAAPLADFARADAWLADQFNEATLAAKPFAPLPVLGVPGWCAANENFSYYDDSLVFRPRARRS
ncbi:DUF3025 domain-containing protein [Ramlibacter sp. AN1015]|uniref:DUF3025 domain-containing protein n=1 Tax=Ramlibacter sp. AN1015 TaxID=3133428 RepID=UPI0030BC0287